MLAARNEHIINKIKPALIEKKVVICDRFVDLNFSLSSVWKKSKLEFYKFYS